MNKILVLGGGRIGATIAKDLSSDHQVTLADVNIKSLQDMRSYCQLIQTDVSNETALSTLVKPFDVVVGALPSRLGFNCLKSLIEFKKHVVDISFFAEDALQLNQLAKTNGITALVDFGLAPGLSNLFAGHCYAEYDDLNNFHCMVGGLPVERTLPYEYKAPFAPLDVIEEYTRPARMRRDGQDIVLPALSEIETLYFNGVGDVQAFNTDGLRSLLQTLDIPNMAEKTIRYPGHAQLMQQLTDGGFFQAEHIQATAQVLLKQWQFADKEQDITLMQIQAEGIIDNKHTVKRWQLIDHYDTEQNTSSMARTTGYTCAAGVRMALQHELPTGVVPAEIIGQDASLFKFLIEELRRKKIIFESTHP